MFSSLTLYSIINFNSYNYTDISPSEYYFSLNNFFWPVPGYHQITSYFGPRNSPTLGASSNHSGIDIAVPEGANIYSVTDGFVSFIGFNGPYGHSIIIQNNNFEFLYAHISPNYIVNFGDYILANTPIGIVGPKYLSSGNLNYTDSSGKFTNGATTGPHLHLTIKKDGKAVNPLLYFNKD